MIDILEPVYLSQKTGSQRGRDFTLMKEGFTDTSCLLRLRSRTECHSRVIENRSQKQENGTNLYSVIFGVE